jgi:hypothetical protein
MSCPHTSAQNGKAERIIRSINNVVRSLLIQVSIHPHFWATALRTTTHLLNILPTKTLALSTPHFALFGKPPSYEHLRVFGCTCYPNLSAQPHTNSPLAPPFVFSLGTALTTRATFVSIVIPTASSFRATWSLTKPHFPFLRILLHPRVRHLIFWMIQLIRLQLLLDCHPFPFFQVPL